MLKYWYDTANNVTWVSEGDFKECYEGKLDHKFVHEKYDQLVFEILPSDDIIALPVDDQEQKD